MRVAILFLPLSVVLTLAAGAEGGLVPPPQRLVGTYAATVPSYPAIGLYGGRYKLVIGPRPEITYIVPGEGRIPQGASFQGTRVTFSVGGACVTRGTYTWALRGRALTFAKVRDSCPHRAVTLVRRWQRLG